MTKEKFAELPELLTRRQVKECGVPEGSIDYLRHALKDGEESAPAGKIGALQLPGRKCVDPKKAKFKYRKADVGRICGLKGN